MSRLTTYLSSKRSRLQLMMCCQVPTRYLRGIKFPHPVGIVIGDGVRIGEEVRIYQNVTIGLAENTVDAKPSDYPTIADEVCIYAGAVIVGNITVGARSIIGANAVITCDVPPDAIAFGYNQVRSRRGRSVAGWERDAE